MKDNKGLIVYKENIFIKIKNFFRSLFGKKESQEIKTIKENTNMGETKKKFNEFISFKENKQELEIINKVRQNPEILKQMSMKELDEVENAIKNRKNFVDKKIVKLKTDLMMRKKGLINN